MKFQFKAGDQARLIEDRQPFVTGEIVYINYVDENDPSIPYAISRENKIITERRRLNSLNYMWLRPHRLVPATMIRKRKTNV